MSYEIREWTKGETFFPNFDPIKAEHLAIKASLVTRRGKNTIFKISTSQGQDEELLQEWKVNIKTTFLASFRDQTIQDGQPQPISKNDGIGLRYLQSGSNIMVYSLRNQEG